MRTVPALGVGQKRRSRQPPTPPAPRHVPTHPPPLLRPGEHWSRAEHATQAAAAHPCAPTVRSSSSTRIHRAGPPGRGTDLTGAGRRRVPAPALVAASVLHRPLASGKPARPRPSDRLVPSGPRGAFDLQHPHACAYVRRVPSSPRLGRVAALRFTTGQRPGLNSCAYRQPSGGWFIGWSSSRKEGAPF